MRSVPARRWRDRFSGFAVAVVEAAGSLIAVSLAVLMVLTWLTLGLVQGFTTRWFEILFATTASITFMMAFLIQHSAKRDNRALSLKLDELINVDRNADNELLKAEERPLGRQEELQEKRPDPDDRD